MQRRFLAAGITAAAALASGNALAIASASATLDGFNYTVIDLNPGDGMAASAQVLTATASANSQANGPGLPSSFQGLPGAFSTTQASASTPLGSVLAATSASGGSVTGFLLNAGNLGNASFSATAMPLVASVTIGAWSLVEFSASFLASAITTVGAVGGSFESAFVTGSLQFTLTENDGSQSANAQKQAFAGALPVGSGYVGMFDSRDSVVKLSWANLSGQDVTGTLFMSTSVYLSSSLPAVPEPAPAALLLAGLALLRLRRSGRLGRRG